MRSCPSRRGTSLTPAAAIEVLAHVHYSSILVVADPRGIDQCAHELESLPGVEVHFVDPERGRIIAVQESESLETQQDGLRRIQALSWVCLAALVEHRVDEERAVQV